MGAKQSSPAPNGRTRAYSGSDLPSATASSSSNGSSRSVAASSSSAAGSGAGLGSGRLHLAPPPVPGPRPAAGGSSGGGGAGGGGGRNPSLNIPNSAGTYGSSLDESEDSTPEESTAERPGGQAAPRLLIGSLPAHLSPHLFGGFKCPVCSKFVSTDEMDLHLVMCLTKPRVTYNEDVLSKDTGECAICLEELQQGDTIARLPCLCIYHKGCIDSWFEVNRSCPEHPSD
ncbi:E3 ubiquitin-protein ligase znrf2 [Scyliorhinus canicula]|uniref:E3 ubiquitin-protein ligase znrf2 n=1 Tax=Scyliorhinus canicula TaxID=7830 RepID=UPI0018F754DB|nr:E3 ubiquitin-protein ligase znrf2 [Scyliorhinus canicula]